MVAGVVTECPSLGGVILPAKSVKFFKKDSKLRVNLLDRDQTEYDLRVTCKYLRDLLDPMATKDFEAFNEESALLAQIDKHLDQHAISSRGKGQLC